MDLHRGTTGVGEDLVHSLALERLHQDVGALAGDTVPKAVHPVRGACRIIYVAATHATVMSQALSVWKSVSACHRLLRKRGIPNSQLL